ncbi:MAG TPA: cobalamin biosynthesis protein CobN [Archaeoglobus profundus]|nr:cobalamin biosynthesis protein CobN [Archaeoglobus profundus]
MKLAIAGKGGVGKTTLAAMLAYLFARDGYKVTAIDCDSSINLPFVLGIKEKIKPLSELKDIIQQRVVGPFGMYKLNPKVDDIFEKYSVKTKHNIRVLVLGTINKGGEGCFCPESAFLRAILRHAIFKSKDVLILDMEAGIEHLGRATAKGVDLLIAVVEPSLRSIDTLNRIEKLAKDIGINTIAVVINKFRKEYENLIKLIKQPILGVIPYSECFIKADLEGIPPFELGCELEAFEKIKNNIIKLLNKNSN